MQVENNVITNIILCNQEFASQIGAIPFVEGADIGDIWDGEKFVKPIKHVDIAQVINNRLESFQNKAPEMLRELYVANTLAGITTAQSDQMFDDFQDVLQRIREGAWPTAVFRLQQKTPQGFVTQELINTWIAKIQAYL